MRNNIRKYKHHVKKNFGKITVEEQEMLNIFFRNIDEYSNVELLTYSELVDQFGSPDVVYCTYVNNSDNDILNSDNDILIKKQSQRNKQILLTIFITLLIFFLVIIIMISNIKNRANDSFIDREKIEILTQE